MLTEQDLHDAMAEAVDDPAAEQLTIGLSDRALAEARGGSWLRRSMAGKRGRWFPAMAVGSAFAVTAAVALTGVALGGGGGGSDGGSQASLTVPAMPSNPVGQSALTEFVAECFNEHGPKLDLSYVWDPATQQYHGVEGDVTTIFQASPDGKQALVERGMPGTTQSWAVAAWPDAVAGRLVPHPIADREGMRWTADGKEVVTELAWDTVKESGDVVLKSKNADFFDPASGRLLASVLIPQKVREMATSGQWSIQQWQGDHDSVLFPLLSMDGSQLQYLNVQGMVVRTLTLQEGLPGDSLKPTEWTEFSPDGRYLAESEGSVLAIFDLQAGGKRVGWMDATGNVSQGWIGDHQIVTAADKENSRSGKRGDTIPLTGHSAVYTVLSPELKVLQQTKFVLPADSQGACATWPMSWAPKSQFPGAFVP